MKAAVREEVVPVEPVAVRLSTAAGVLDCSVSTIRKLVKEKKLETVKVGNDDRVTVKSLKALAA